MILIEYVCWALIMLFVLIAAAIVLFYWVNVRRSVSDEDIQIDTANERRD